MSSVEQLSNIARTSKATVTLPLGRSFRNTSRANTAVYKYTVFTVIVLALCGCARHDTVSKKIAEQLRSGASQLDIGRTADFAWDDVFIFSPYYPQKEICEQVRVTEGQCSAAEIKDVDESEFLLVFMRGGSLVKVENFSRKMGDFDRSCIAKPIAREAALFSVERSPRINLVCR